MCKGLISRALQGCAMSVDAFMWIRAFVERTLIGLLTSCFWRSARALWFWELADQDTEHVLVWAYIGILVEELLFNVSPEPQTCNIQNSR